MNSSISQLQNWVEGGGLGEGFYHDVHPGNYLNL